MAKIVLFEEQTLSFSYDEEIGVWFSSVFESVPNFTVGETYKVVWDGVTYNCVAQDVDALITGAVAVGNLTAWGLDGNNEPFIFGSNPSMSFATVFSLYDTAPSAHTVGVYQGEDVGVLLTNNKGEDVAYFGVENILIRTTEDGATQSGQQNFTKGEAIEGLEIELSLGNGDQILQASEGYLVKSAVIKKPDTLVPENIVKDVEIAGVIGTHEGGGDYVKYVTFMYGTTELIKYPVIVGDTVHDPVAKGLIDTPTKESTVSHVYTFGGWSMIDGGAPDSSALQNVTEDRTVYAAFNEEPRYYTVRFFDGDTLVNTEQVPYGGSSAYYYEKEGYAFNGWTPEPTNITGDLDCYASFVEKVGFAGATWAQVIEKANDGTAYTDWAVGDTRDLTLNYADGTSETVTVMLANKSQSTLQDGTKDNMSIVLTQPLQKLIPFATSYQQLPGMYTAGEMSETVYNNINYVSFLRETVLPALPSELQVAIKARRHNVGSSGVIVYEKVWGLPLYNSIVPYSFNKIMTPRNSTDPVIWYAGDLYYHLPTYYPRGYDAMGKVISDTAGRAYISSESVYTANNGVVFGFCL